MVKLLEQLAVTQKVAGLNPEGLRTEKLPLSVQQCSPAA